MRKVFGIGETILDIIFRNDQPQKAVPGGSVFNGLISLGRLNVPVSFISELGNDRVGDMIRDFMEDNHITTEFVDRFPDGKSPISLAFLDDDKNANYIFYKDYPAQRLEVPLPKIEKDRDFRVWLLLFPEPGLADSYGRISAIRPRTESDHLLRSQFPQGTRS